MTTQPFAVGQAVRLKEHLVGRECPAWTGTVIHAGADGWIAVRLTTTTVIAVPAHRATATIDPGHDR